MASVNSYTISTQNNNNNNNIINNKCNDVTKVGITLKVYAKCLAPDIEYKTVIVTKNMSSKELICLLLSKCRMKHRDPKAISPWYFNTFSHSIKAQLNSELKSAMFLFKVSASSKNFPVIVILSLKFYFNSFGHNGNIELSCIFSFINVKIRK